MKYPLTYDLEWKCRQFRSEIKLHILCILILIALSTKAFDIVNSKGKSRKEK